MGNCTLWHLFPFALLKVRCLIERGMALISYFKKVRQKLYNYIYKIEKKMLSLEILSINNERWDLMDFWVELY